MLADPTEPRAQATSPDPHGQAALLLVESLIHALVGNRVMSVRDAVGAMDIAIDAQLDMVDAGRSPAAATHLLEAIRCSMESDLPHADND